MLVLSRKLNQEIQIGDNIKITVLKIKGNTVRLGIEAPRDVHIVRGELEPKQHARPETANSPTQKAEPKGEDGQYGQFTVVFSNADEVQTSKVDVIPFDGDSNSNQLNSPKGLALESVEKRPEVQTIQYREKLPESLAHNRLKEIVDQMLTKKK